MTQSIGLITSTYAYHPATEEPDLVVPTEVVAHYWTQRPGPLRGDFAPLEFALKTEGVQKPLRIATDGQWAVLIDGHSRLRIARKLGIIELPIQVVPDNLRRMPMKYGRAALEPVVAEWVSANIRVHVDHEVLRRRVGAKMSSGGIPDTSLYLRCECSCGSKWKEEA